MGGEKSGFRLVIRRPGSLHFLELAQDGYKRCKRPMRNLYLRTNDISLTSSTLSHWSSVSGLSGETLEIQSNNYCCYYYYVLLTSHKPLLCMLMTARELFLGCHYSLSYHITSHWYDGQDFFARWNPDGARLGWDTPPACRSILCLPRSHA